jgi:DNA-binding CsgD family transcriptional regulator
MGHCENAGFKVRNSYEQWRSRNDHRNLSPVIYSMDRSESIAGDNMFMIRLFAYQEPKLRLPDAQRELLHLARFESTDEWLADQLSISVHAVKKRWQAIYSRIDEVMPGLLPIAESDVRGKGKKRVLMSYIQNNPSELWPYLP